MREYREPEKDLLMLIPDFLKQAKQLASLGIVLMLLWALVGTSVAWLRWSPEYEATALVAVETQVYSSGSYSAAAAKQVEKAVPNILTSDVLKHRVLTALNFGEFPAPSVTASVDAHVISVTVRDSDGCRAKAVLEGILLHYPQIAEPVLGESSLTLLEDIHSPETPANPFRIWKKLLQGAAAGTAIWLLTAAVLALSKDTVHSESELQELGCDCLARVWEEASDGETLRRLSLRVEKQLREQNRKVLLVCAALSGEGSSVMADHLAQSLARRGNRVLLVGCSRDSAPDDAKPGLAEYLRGEISIRDAVRSGKTGNLYVISGGSGGNSLCRTPKSRERMSQLISGCRIHFDCILLDAPGCWESPDAAQMGQLADCALLVVRRDHAARHQILEGAELLEEGGLSLMGWVLKDAEKRDSPAATAEAALKR